MKCAVCEFNHSVIQNTITVHTWTYVIILQETNGKNTELAANPLWCYCSVSRGENRLVFLNSKIKHHCVFLVTKEKKQWASLRLKHCASVYINHAFNYLKKPCLTLGLLLHTQGDKLKALISVFKSFGQGINKYLHSHDCFCMLKVIFLRFEYTIAICRYF